MYEFMIGTVDSIQPAAVIINVNGIGYYIYMANPYRFSADVNKSVKVWLHQVVSENDMRLYGFISADEKLLFLQLISVSGIGPRSALSILSLDDHSGLVRAIESGDNAFLTKFPGVGKKTAQQMILDLSGKVADLLENIAADHDDHGKDETNLLMAELEEALASLGYSAREIQRVSKGADFTGVTSTAEAIRISLRFMMTK